MRFTDEHIRIENGKHLLEFTQRKTGKNITIPLLPKVCELAEINELTKGSKLVETEKDSKVYRKKTGIYKKYKLVTSHIGRRSFATNFYGKIPTSFLIYMTGHSTEAMFLNYIGKSNKDIALEMTKYF